MTQIQLILIVTGLYVYSSIKWYRRNFMSLAAKILFKEKSQYIPLNQIQWNDK